VAGQGESLPSFTPRLPGAVPEQPDIPALSARLNTAATEIAFFMEETSHVAWILSFLPLYLNSFRSAVSWAEGLF
jgi:hypothetical protein